MHFLLQRPHPVVGAPMAGATTPELAAAVSEAGGLGFLAAGYRTSTEMAAEVEAYRRLTGAPVALNLFTPQTDRTAELAARLEIYRAELAGTAAGYGVEPGRPTFDDDDFEAKIAWLTHHRVDAVTFTFGPVPGEVVTALAAVGTAVGFTVTSAHEARQAAGIGADFLVAQGAEAGGHRGTWHVSDVPNEHSAADVTRAVVGATGLPTVAAGGVAGGDDVRALLGAGAIAVAVGTLFVTAAESRSPAAHQDALLSGSCDASVGVLRV